MRKMHPHHFFDFFFIHSFQRAETLYIKKLKDMKWMKKYTKNNNIYFFAIIIEFDKIMTVMIIQNQKSTSVCHTKFDIILKMM